MLLLLVYAADCSLIYCWALPRYQLSLEKRNQILTDMIMKPKVYIETTIPSYLTAWRSPDLVMAANQETTKEWWDNRNQFELYVSAFSTELYPGRCSQLSLISRISSASVII